ncbi:probable transmembrane ascorbate ferrireductase 4 [Amaranthus tricolor]|uniref:probable transmembrane ascorbate ferrireductase 4 n=1 Tax=Amaranthus tricolor TaxID=29722 RepID=UPI00258ECE1F|nr:probable transmembrane ascorbate ferrireductase 4 [Amaranthus tricolor]
MSSSTFPLLTIARLSAIFVASLVLIWARVFKTSFIPRSPSSNDTLIFAVLHPLLMVIGFIILSGEAILVHRWLPGSRNVKKTVHLGMQGVALGCGILGIWTKFHGEDGVVANFYSLHSWMGLVSISLFGIEWVMGFMSFWHRGEMRRVSRRMLPWHVFIGLYTYGLSVATAETGLLEKLTFMQTYRNVPRRGSESILVNGLGLGLAFLAGIVIFAALSPKHHQLSIRPLKPIYSNDKY